jgi:hypothetical protein
MLALLTSAAGRYIGYAALAVSLAGGAAWILHTHDARVRAEQQIAIDAVTAGEVAWQHAATVAALEQTAADAQARATALEQIRTAIHAAPITTSCAGSPAIRALLDGLRGQAVRGPRAAASDPGQPAKLPR